MNEKYLLYTYTDVDNLLYAFPQTIIMKILIEAFHHNIIIFHHIYEYPYGIVCLPYVEVMYAVEW